MPGGYQKSKSCLHLFDNLAGPAICLLSGLTVWSSDGVTMTSDPAGRANRIDSLNLDGSTSHTPEGIDVAYPQAEHDGPKAALKFPMLTA